MQVCTDKIHDSHVIRCIVYRRPPHRSGRHKRHLRLEHLGSQLHRPLQRDFLVQNRRQQGSEDSERAQPRPHLLVRASVMKWSTCGLSAFEHRAGIFVMSRINEKILSKTVQSTGKCRHTLSIYCLMTKHAWWHAHVLAKLLVRKIFLRGQLFQLRGWLKMPLNCLADLCVWSPRSRWIILKLGVVVIHLCKSYFLNFIILFKTSGQAHTRNTFA